MPRQQVYDLDFKVHYSQHPAMASPPIILWRNKWGRGWVLILQVAAQHMTLFRALSSFCLMLLHRFGTRRMERVANQAIESAKDDNRDAGRRNRCPKTGLKKILAGRRVKTLHETFNPNSFAGPHQDPLNLNPK